jgi:hypothetical protein
LSCNLIYGVHKWVLRTDEPNVADRPLLPHAKSTAAAAAINSVDESKLHLIFCISGHCDCWGGWKECQCWGEGDHKENCYHNTSTMDECRDCNPGHMPTAGVYSVSNGRSTNWSTKDRYLTKRSLILKSTITSPMMHWCKWCMNVTVQIVKSFLETWTPWV